MQTSSWVCPHCQAPNVPGAPSCHNCRAQFGPPPGQGRGLADDPVLRHVIPVGLSPLAIAAGYAGLFALVVVPAPIALVLGILALVSLNKHPDKRGRGRAVFGVVAGGLGTAALVAIIVASSM